MDLSVIELDVPNVSENILLLNCIAENNGDTLHPVDHADPEDRTRSQCQSAPPSLDNAPLEGYSSIETLLMNIQGLLKVAAENARHQERKTGMEKGKFLLTKTHKVNFKFSIHMHVRHVKIFDCFCAVNEK